MMHRQSFVNAMLNIAVGAFALAANAADMNYTPSGTPPYLWSDTTAWGGALPTADDNATVSQTALKTARASFQCNTGRFCLEWLAC